MKTDSLFSLLEIVITCACLFYDHSKHILFIGSWNWRNIVTTLNPSNLKAFISYLPCDTVEKLDGFAWVLFCRFIVECQGPVDDTGSLKSS